MSDEAEKEKRVDKRKKPRWAFFVICGVVFIALVIWLMMPSPKMANHKYIGKKVGFEIPEGETIIYHNEHDNWFGDGDTVILMNNLLRADDLLTKMESGASGFQCGENLPEGFEYIYESIYEQTDIELDMPEGRTCWLLLVMHDFENIYGGITKEYLPSTVYGERHPDAKVVVYDKERNTLLYADTNL